MAKLKPFQLLEISIMSAQDLEPSVKKMKTYASAWVHPNRKLSTHVDTEGNINPTWNDKFVFHVDEEFLRLDTSAVMIEIYAVNWFWNTLVGTVRVLVGNLIPPPTRPHHHHHLGMRFVALQVRRPSGRPQGILNVGVALLDSSMRSMPLYTQLSTSAVGYRDLMGEEDPHHPSRNQNQPSNVKPILRRSRSDRSERVTFDNVSATNSSMIVLPPKNGEATSIISDGPPLKPKNKKGKGSSVISGAELRDKATLKGKKGKASSTLSDSISVAKGNRDIKQLTNEKPGWELGLGIGAPVKKTSGKLIIEAPPKPNSLSSDSEVGPSPSEVAAAMLEKRYPLEEERSSVLDGWSMDESVEGLRSKLERWRTELPPIYDCGLSSSLRSTSNHARRHSDGGSGLFSCFSNVYGYECQCTCGKPPARKGLNDRFGSAGRSFL